MKWIFGTFIALTMTACDSEQIPEPTTGADPVADYRSHPKNTVYQKELQNFTRRWNIPGSILLLKRADESLWIGAVGHSNLEHQTSMRLDDPFRTASITKTFVATGVMKMREQGKLQLEDKLETLLPEVGGNIPDAEKITIRHLLGHTSGIFDPTNDDLQYNLDLFNNPTWRQSMSTDDLLKKYVYNRPLLFQPGDRFRYSNTNYWLLGKIIENVTGMNLQTALNELIFKPAGLTKTYIEHRDSRNVVRGYNNLYSNGKLMDVTALDRAESDGQAHGGLISTVEDLFKFSEAFFGGKIISLASVNEMMTVQPVRQGTNEYGLGLDSYTTDFGTAWGHNGTLLGVDANWFYFPDKKAVYILFNNNGGGSDKSAIHNLLK